ncbi:helix-turn-helix domain-containing protein [Actinomadura luteofluorescens]|uniref:helix-turn-helix domain-containing protein n=1 Tax=Actinomadura luteofluorescens TaxID=46163 RepID=UPI003D8DC711
MSGVRGNTGRWSPTVRRQRLAHVLAQLRERDGRTAAQIAELLGVAETTVTRLENPKHLTLPKAGLIERVLDIYGADDDTRRAVAALVVEARQRDWWHRYKPGLPPAFGTYLGLEGEVAVLRMFQSALIPAALATVDYATGLLCEQLPDLPEEEVCAFVAERHQRHLNLLSGPDPVRVWVVLGEAALRQAVGGPAVMAGQMLHLQRLMNLPNVTLTVLPLAAGAHPGVGPFTVLTFPEPADPEMAYLPDPLGGHWVKGRSVDDLRGVFEEILALAVDRAETIALIEEVAAGYAG